MRKTTIYVTEIMEKNLNECIELTRMKRSDIIGTAVEKFLQALKEDGYNINKLKI